MPNSSGGQQEEEMEVGEEQEQEQGEEQVVKRKIAVSKMPTSSSSSEMVRFSLQLELESYFVPVKVNTMRVAIEKRMLREVAFTEKVISTSFCESRLSHLQHFVLDSNEKKVKAGKSSRDG